MPAYMLCTSIACQFRIMLKASIQLLEAVSNIMPFLPTGRTWSKGRGNGC